MSRIVYSFFIELYYLAFRLVAIFSSKARKRVSGLRAQKLKPYNERNVILIHCSSAGEFEQALPVIEQMQALVSTHRFVISFFSPSGIEWMQRKKYNYDYYYLPFDRRKDQKNFLKALQPTAVLITKNEFWFNFFDILDNQQIPHFLIAAAFKKNHFAFKNSYFLQKLQGFQHIFLLDKDSKDYSSNFLKNTTLGGDPRIDQIFSKNKSLVAPTLFNNIVDKPIFIFASVHKEDLAVINSIIDDSTYQYIIVPHEVSAKSINYFIQNFPQASIFSKVKSWAGEPIIVDEIGLLSSLYKIGSYSYIGGGFGKGIHNILEAAVCGNIIFIGPNNKKFPEARFFLQNQAIVEITKAEEFPLKLQEINQSQLDSKKLKMTQFFDQEKGAGSYIADKISKLLNEDK